MAPVRRGGQARNALGDRLIWSEAEGERGTRWREALEREGQLLRALLLEASPAGRPTRLEMTTGAGLLTLHPEPDESVMHGNVVGRHGVRHLALPWSAEHELFVSGSPATATIAVRRLNPRLTLGASTELDVLRIDDDLAPTAVRWRIERVGADAWQMANLDGSDARRMTVASDGRPILLDEASWPLEL
jgi:hypothetical protein